MPTATDTTSADLSDTDATTSLYRAAIGSVGTAYYMRVFNRFEAADRAGPSWNWAAALLTLNWMAYRQLWHAALVYAGVVTALPLLVFGLGRLVLKWPEEVELGALLTIVSALIAVPGLYGNALYHAHCRKRMASALAAKPTLEESCALLQSHASSRARLIWLAAANVAVLGATLFAYVQSQGLAFTAKEPVASARQVAVGRTTDLSPEAPAPAPAPAPALQAATNAVPSPATPTATQDAGKPAISTAPAAAAQLPTPGLAATNTLAGGRASTTNATPANQGTTGPTANASPSSTAPPVNPVAAQAASIPSAASTGAGPKPMEPKLSAAEPVTPAESSAAKATQAAAVLAAKEAKQSKPVKPAPKATEPKADVAKLAAPPKEPPAIASAPKNQTAKTGAKPADPHYYINVGLFADDNNARNAYVKLMDAGLPAFRQELNTSKGKRTRVRVGPFDTEAQAENNANRIQTLGLDAQVFESPNVIDTSGN